MTHAYLEMPYKTDTSYYDNDKGERVPETRMSYLIWERREYNTKYLQQRAIKLSAMYAGATFRVHESRGYGSNEFWYYRAGEQILHTANANTTPEYKLDARCDTKVIYSYDIDGKLHTDSNYIVENGDALFDYLMKHADDKYTIVTYNDNQRVIRKFNRKREEVDITEVHDYVQRAEEKRARDENALVPSFDRSVSEIRGLTRDQYNKVTGYLDGMGLVDHLNHLADDIDVILSQSGITGDEYLRIVNLAGGLRHLTGMYLNNKSKGE